MVTYSSSAGACSIVIGSSILVSLTYAMQEGSSSSRTINSKLSSKTLVKSEERKKHNRNFGELIRKRDQKVKISIREDKDLYLNNSAEHWKRAAEKLQQEAEKQKRENVLGQEIKSPVKELPKVENQPQYFEEFYIVEEESESDEEEPEDITIEDIVLAHKYNIGFGVFWSIVLYKSQPIVNTAVNAACARMGRRYVGIFGTQALSIIFAVVWSSTVIKDMNNTIRCQRKRARVKKREKSLKKIGALKK